MECEGIRGSGHEYLSGGCGPDEAATIEAHLATCAGCEADLKHAGSVLSLLKTLPELEPSTENWNRIESKLTEPRPAVESRTAGFRTWLRVAAAASVLVAVASFALLAGMRRTGALPMVVETSKALEWNETFTAPRLTTLLLQDVGTFKLDQDTRMRFTGPRECVLESGNLLADIIPSGRGFEVKSGDTSVRVHGTRFGVASPSTVYVLEGRVRVESPRGRIELVSQQVAVNSTLVKADADDYLGWLNRHREPSLKLVLDPQDHVTVTPGAPMKWTLTLESDSDVPVWLGAPRDVSQLFSLLINGRPAALAPDSAALIHATRGAGGFIRLDAGHPCVIECAVSPALFREKGPATVRARFASGDHAPRKAWKGFLESNELTVEVNPQ